MFYYAFVPLNRAPDSTARLSLGPNAHLPLVTQKGAYFLILLGRKWNCNSCALVTEEPARRENFLCCSAGRLGFSPCRRGREAAEGSARPDGSWSGSSVPFAYYFGFPAPRACTKSVPAMNALVELAGHPNKLWIHRTMCAVKEQTKLAESCSISLKPFSFIFQHCVKLCQIYW